MIAQGGGRIISLAGDSARVGEARLAVTAASRGGVLALTKSLAKELGRNAITVNAIALGLECRTFEIDHYLCWGTPEELRCFEYWQSCFHKWPSHPYSLATDADVPATAMALLEARYAPVRPPLPSPDG